MVAVWRSLFTIVVWYSRIITAMAELHVIGALRNKRAELGGVVSQLEKPLVHERANLTHLDATTGKALGLQGMGTKRGDMPDYSNTRTLAFKRFDGQRPTATRIVLSNLIRRLTIDWRHQALTPSSVTGPEATPNMVRGVSGPSIGRAQRSFACRVSSTWPRW
jgi:hypothetical protein